MATVATKRTHADAATLARWRERNLDLYYAWGVADAKAGDPPQLVNTIPAAVREAYSQGYNEAREAGR
ncbi:MAG: hypothetical protein WC718_14915 [Phycisphaerales bacterium]|jgi:hypothetical protein